MDPANVVRVCCDMIVEKNGKVLMGKRGNVFGKDSWAFPGGHLEVGETTKQCVIRELDEEVGIYPTKMELLGIINDIPDLSGTARHYVRFVYKTEIYKGEISNKEPDKCMGWKWFDKTDLPKPIFVGHVKILKLYKEDKFNILFE